MSSNKRNGVEVIQRIVALEWPEAFLAQLQATDDVVWLSKTTKCLRHQIKGLPMRDVDVLIQTGLSPSDVGAEIEPLCVEIVAKLGKFNGRQRFRVTVRRWHKGTSASFQPGNLTADVIDAGDHGSVWISVTGYDGESLWAEKFSRLRMELEGYDTGAIVIWHLNRYFRHLLDDHYADATQIAEAWTPESADLAGANREASRLLYGLSKELGWVRLTLRERRRIWGDDAADRPIWHRREELDAARMMAGIGSPTGCGQHTLEISRGWSPPSTDMSEYA